MGISKHEYLKRVARCGNRLTNLERAVLVVIYTYTDSNLENAWPGLRRLADDLGHKSTSSIKSTIATLKRKGFLIQTGGGRPGRGEKRTNAVYRLMLPADLMDGLELGPTPVSGDSTTKPAEQAYSGTDSLTTRPAEQTTTRPAEQAMTKPAEQAPYQINDHIHASSIKRHLLNAREGDDALTIEKFNKEKNRQLGALAALAEEVGR